MKIVGIDHNDALPDVRRFYTFDPLSNLIEFIQNGDGISQG
jgi:hypothetical protein